MTPQTSIAHYRITGSLGEGGMGAVYRAQDTKLGRDVAIKVLPPALAADADYIARFQREAQVLASLNHPNIAAIYGLEENAIVMELVEGTEPKGPLPPDEVIRIGKQIADALEAAHERGIVHRDLKPANIRITPDGTVKVLDFGLAKASEPAQSATSVANSPTLTIHATTAGVILGTAAYMAPEQAAGKPVDRRPDIWAFGVVLWELITGRQLFQGDTVTEMMAAVLRDQIELAVVPAGPLRTLISRCLERDVRKRLGWIGEARAILEQPAPAAPVAKRGWALPVLAAVAITAAVAGVAEWLLQSKAAPSPVRRFRIEVPVPATELHRFAALSPDGRRITWTAENKLWVRDIDSEHARAVDSAVEATSPCWSPDGEWIAFYAPHERAAMKMRANGENLVRIAETGSRWGCSWNDDGTSIVTSGGLSLYEMSSSGATSRRVLFAAFGVRGLTGHSWPSHLPGKRRALLTVEPRSRVAVVNLDDGSTEDLGVAGFAPVWSPSGHILYHRHGGKNSYDVWAAPFDVAGQRISGEPFQVAKNAAFPSVSRDGTLLYSDAPETVSAVRLFDRSGKVLGDIGEPYYSIVDIAFSRDARRLAVVSGEVGSSSLSIYDLESRSRRRLTYDLSVLRAPVWSPDGREILFTSNRQSSSQIFLQPADGNREAVPITGPTTQSFVTDWSVDGRFILYHTASAKTSHDLRYLERSGEGKWEARDLLVTTQTERNAVLSPDGRYYAYTSDQTGRPEIFVREFPRGSAEWQVSTDGGVRAQWSADGKELIYASNRELIAVPISTAGTFSAGKPTRLFAVSVGVASVLQKLFAVLPDGRIASAEPAATDRRLSLHIVENWLQAVKK